MVGSRWILEKELGVVGLGVCDVVDQHGSADHPIDGGMFSADDHPVSPGVKPGVRRQSARTRKLLQPLQGI